MGSLDNGRIAAALPEALGMAVGLHRGHLSVLSAYGERLFARRDNLTRQLCWFLLRHLPGIEPGPELGLLAEQLADACQRLLSGQGNTEGALAVAARRGLDPSRLAGLTECLFEYLLPEVDALDEPRVVRAGLSEALRKQLLIELSLMLSRTGLPGGDSTARLYATLSGVCLALVRAADRDALFADICRICVEQGGFTFAWIGLIDREAGCIRPVALAGDGAEAFIPDIRVRLDSDAPSARAVTTLSPQVVEETGDDPGLAPWTDQLTKSRVRSMLVIPLLLRDEAHATLVLYAREPGVFNHDAVGLVRAMSGEISHALERQEALERSRKAETQLAYLTQHDPLTGLPNRQLMLKHLGEMIAATPEDGTVAVLTLAIDGFHELNARLGHECGDEVLREVALRMSRQALPYGPVGRVGATRFVAASDGSAPIDRLVTDLQAVMREPVPCGGESVTLRCSIGVMRERAAVAEAAAMMRCSDLALIRAREAGGDLCRFYDEAMDVEIQRQHVLRGEFARALAAGELELFFQPKIDLTDGKICGVEALVRWRRGDGYMTPGEFFPAIEHTDLMRELDWWVMGEALRHSSVWMAQGKLIPVSVNLSAMTLRHESFLPRIQALIMRHPIPDGHLELEVLETVSQQEAEEIIHKLESCREFGISIALDDFGTGASSLVHLQQLPFDTIKIDQRFVRKLLKAPGNEAIIRSMISFAHYTGRKLVVEGVESQPIWDRLLEIGCTSGQGFAISAPVSASGLMAWLAGRENAAPEARQHGDLA